MGVGVGFICIDTGRVVRRTWNNLARSVCFRRILGGIGHPPFVHVFVILFTLSFYIFFVTVSAAAAAVMHTLYAHMSRSSKTMQNGASL